MNKVVELDYVNWRNARTTRRILPHHVWWGSTSYHPGDQWLLSATDLNDCVTKNFAMSGVRGWRHADDQSLPWRTK